MTDELYVESGGRGAPIVLLHGWGMHGGIWDECAAALADGWRVSKVDLPGHGRSVPRPGIDRIDGLTEIVARHAPRRMTLIGWSLGGMVAMGMAQHQPQRVERKVKEFVGNLMQAIAIVMIVMLISLGLRTGLVVAALMHTGNIGAADLAGPERVPTKRMHPQATDAVRTRFFQHIQAGAKEHVHPNSRQFTSDHITRCPG